MTIEWLKNKLTDGNYREDSYDFTGTESECYCLISSGNKWEVFYSERGLKTGLKKFTSESDACSYFWDWISSDSSTKKERFDRNFRLPDPNTGN